MKQKTPQRLQKLLYYELKLKHIIKQTGVDAFDFFDVNHVTNTPGLWNHTNVRKDKVDMFPQQELIDMLLSL